jgi:hypothetical protein
MPTPQDKTIYFCNTYKSVETRLIASLLFLI